jgi:hypothetical protein
MTMPNNVLGSHRDFYADMWFRHLAVGVVKALAASNFSVSSSQIHDKMPMEVDADEKAAEIVVATGIGTMPGLCPTTSKFSTRTYRGCRCATGKKQYEGTFKRQATCR